jgi:hypothetical protein
MSDDISLERVTALADGSRVALPPGGAARIARAVTPMLARFAAGAIAMPLEAEPSTFVAVQHKDSGR